MKMNLRKVCYLIFAAVLLVTSCNESEDIVTGDAKEGAFLSIAGSSGQLAGAPESGVELEDAEIDFEAAALTYSAEVVSGAESVSKLVVKKTFGTQSIEVANSTDPTILVEYDDLSDFLEGFEGVTPSDLRVGDVFGFQTEITMTDGRVVVNSSGRLNVQVSCLADLSGTYTVTNNACPGDPDFPFTATITKNADGSYHISSADGGFLHRCTGNTTLINAGDIIEQCGTILPSTNLEYGSVSGSYDIGDITGGTWNAETGVLTMTHTQTFFPTRAAEWTSTYVRQ